MLLGWQDENPGNGQLLRQNAAVQYKILRRDRRVAPKRTTQEVALIYIKRDETHVPEASLSRVCVCLLGCVMRHEERE